MGIHHQFRSDWRFDCFSLKRLAGMKDSGGAIPIGGLLDLTDSLILAAPTGYFILLVLKS